MVTSKDCLSKYGEPEKQSHMALYDFDCGISSIPKKIYCNNDMINPLRMAINLVKERGLSDSIKSWDGIFCIRKKRVNDSYSLHSWGIAVDINAFENQMGTKGNMSDAFVKCFKDSGFDWGGEWDHADPMHFQLSKI